MSGAKRRPGQWRMARLAAAAAVVSGAVALLAGVAGHRRTPKKDQSPADAESESLPTSIRTSATDPTADAAPRTHGSWRRVAAGIGAVALVVLGVVLVVPSQIIVDPVIESIRDDLGRKVDPTDPLETGVEAWLDGPSTTLAYALDASTPSVDAHTDILGRFVPDRAIPIGERSDILILTGPDVDEKASLVDVKAVNVSTTDVVSGTKVAVWSGRGDSFPRSYPLALDLNSGDASALGGGPILDSGSAELPRGDSVLLIVQAAAPGPGLYSWVIRLTIATENGELITTFVDVKGDHHASADDASKNPFMVTSEAASFASTYGLDEQGSIVFDLDGED